MPLTNEEDSHDAPSRRGDDDSPGEARRHRGWDPLADYPIGPDDAGNAVMHACALIGDRWRRLRARIRRP